jgi:hypothetical protein
MWQCCSQCKSDYAVDFESGGDVNFCPACVKKQQELATIPANFFSKPSGTASRWWTVGFVAGMLLLLTQIYFIEREKLAQDPEQREWLEKICLRLPCGLSVYKNLDEIEILHGDFQLNGNSHYVFQTVISNQASFAQAYPRIKLVLLDFTGEAFAERIFYPAEYLNLTSSQLLAASQTVEVSLNIAIPQQKIGGYTFELI